MGDNMKASLIQLQMKEYESSAELKKRVFAMIDKCRGADLIVLPELWPLGMISYRTLAEHAEPIDGPLMSAISAKAREVGAYIHCGTFAERDGDKIYNTSLLFDRNGTDIASYRKIHLFSWYGREAESFSHGEKPVVVSTEFGRVGLATCYDLRFPELFRIMSWGMGAEIFIVPSAWSTPRVEMLCTLCAARAIENFAYLLACDITGPYKGLTMRGESRIVSPWGERVTDEIEGEGIVTGNVSSEEVRRIRYECPGLSDVRLLSSAVKKI